MMSVTPSLLDLHIWDIAMDKQTRSEYMKEYRKNNPEKVKEMRRRTYLNQKSRDPEEYNRKATERHNDWVERNRAKAQKLSRDSYERCRKQRLEEKKDYALKYPEKISANNKRQRAQRASAPIGNVQLTEDYYQILRSDPCSYCGTLCEHIDHIIPLSNGGEHGWLNLTAACAPCNQSKHARSLLNFLMDEGRVDA
jgi:5-methylcytosine-specific restriction endonuclease McrA